LQESASVVHAKIDSVVHADDGDDGDDDDEHPCCHFSHFSID
jgi:hypothetical protein